MNTLERDDNLAIIKEAQEITEMYLKDILIKKIAFGLAFMFISAVTANPNNALLTVPTFLLGFYLTATSYKEIKHYEN